MTQPNDTARDGSAPAGENEAAIMSDWTEVVALIGPHPDLTFDGPSQAWVRTWVRAKLTMSIATPSTVDDLMLRHCQRWLRERGVWIRPERPSGFTIQKHGQFRALATTYANEAAATIAAVRAAKGAGNEA